jgi:hypothetical protein
MILSSKFLAGIKRNRKLTILIDKMYTTSMASMMREIIKGIQQGYLELKEKHFTLITKILVDYKSR